MGELSEDKYIIHFPGCPPFEDCIAIPIDEYNAKTPEQIDQLKLSRYTSWRALITHPLTGQEDIEPEVPIHESLMFENGEEVLL